MYYIGFLYLLGLYFVAQNFSKKEKLILTLLPFIVISFLRFGVGADYLSYEIMYLKMDIRYLEYSMDLFPKVEPLFKIIMMLSKFIGIPYHVFVASLNTFIAAIVLIWIERNSSNFFLSSLLYFSMFFLFWNLSAVRQGLTMALMFYVFFNREDKFTIKQKIFITIVSSLVHVASLIIVIIYVASKWKWNRKKLLIILALSPFIKYLLKPEFLMVFSNFPLMGKVIKYLSQDPISFFQFTSLVRLLFFVAIWLHYDLLLEKFRDQEKLINFSILSLLLYFFVPVSKVIATRITIYGYFLTIIVFPMIVSLYEQSKLRILSLVGLLGFSSFSMINELEKAKDRTGYELSINKLNTVTIFNYDLKDFNSDRAFKSGVYHHTTESYNDDVVLQSLISRNIEVENEYIQDLAHFSVKFPNGLYGVINERGEIVALPQEEVRMTIVNDYYIESIYDQYNYSYVQARSFVDNSILLGADLEKILNVKSLAQDKRATSRIHALEFDIEDIANQKFLGEFNYSPLLHSTLNIDSYNDNIRYLWVSTKMDHYYLLLDENNRVLVERWYDSISRINDSNIIEARSRNFREYFDKNGKLIWVEKVD